MRRLFVCGIVVGWGLKRVVYVVEGIGSWLLKKWLLLGLMIVEGKMVNGCICEKLMEVMMRDGRGVGGRSVLVECKVSLVYELRVVVVVSLESLGWEFFG